MEYSGLRGLITILLLLTMTGIACSGNEQSSTAKTEDGVIQNPARGILQDEEPPVAFELVDTIDLSTIEELVISSIGSLQIDGQGNFYFLDRRIHKLISVDPGGNLRWSIGEEGKGPGDFETPLGISLYEEKLYVSNIMGSRIDEFDTMGNFIKSYDLPKEIRFAEIVGVRKDGTILLSGAKFGSIGTSVYTVEVGDSVRVAEKIDITETTDEEYARATTRGSITMRENDFIYSFSTKYANHFYDYEGNLNTEVSRDFDGTMGPGVYASEGSVSMYVLGNMSAPLFLENGNYLVQVRYPTNIDDPHDYARRASTGGAPEPEYKEFMDVFNQDHQLLYTFDDSDFVESLGGLSVRDAQGYYYSPFSNDLMIKKYKVVAAD